MAEELKPCPYCGAKGEYIDYSMTSWGWWEVMCFHCGTKTRDYHSKEEAANAWNMGGVID